MALLLAPLGGAVPAGGAWPRGKGVVTVLAAEGQSHLKRIRGEVEARRAGGVEL